MSTNNLVFVYGTLKRGHGNYHRILSESKFLGEAVLTTPMGMKQVGFPAIYDGGSGVVKGEVFQVSDEETWKRLDSLESNGYMYQREERKFDFVSEEGPHELTEAWVYIATPRFKEQIERSPDILPNERGELVWSPGA